MALAFDYRAQAERLRNNPSQLRRLLALVERQVWQAERIGWGLLAEAFRGDVQHIEQLLERPGVMA